MREIFSEKQNLNHLQDKAPGPYQIFAPTDARVASAGAVK